MRNARLVVLAQVGVALCALVPGLSARAADIFDAITKNDVAAVKAA